MKASAGRVETDIPSATSVIAAEVGANDFDAFYRAEYGRIVKLLFGMTGRWPVAEELTQETLLSAYRDWERVATLERPDLWLRRVAVNRAISARRRLSAEIAAIARVRVDRTVDGPGEGHDDRVWAAIRRLPRTQAAAVVLWSVEGLTLAEIGDVLGCSAETARTHLRRGRARVASTLTEETDVDEG